MDWIYLNDQHYKLKDCTLLYQERPHPDGDMDGYICHTAERYYGTPDGRYFKITTNWWPKGGTFCIFPQKSKFKKSKRIIQRSQADIACIMNHHATAKEQEKYRCYQKKLKT